MKDEREKGIYVEKFSKVIENEEYIKTETTIVNGYNTIVSISIEYDTPIMFGQEADGWKRILV